MRIKISSDADYFEAMSRIVLLTGLNWQIMKNKWPGMKAALADLDPVIVAGFGSAEIDALMQNTAVIRNRGKLEALAYNARQFLAIQDEFGSFGKYIKSLEAQGEAAMIKAIIKRFKFMGKGTTVIFLYQVDAQIPESKKEWDCQHSKSDS